MEEGSIKMQLATASDGSKVCMVSHLNIAKLKLKTI